MPLITCPDCGHQVSDRASFCPNCGCPSSAWQIPAGIPAALPWQITVGIPASLRIGDRFTMGAWGGQSIEWRVLNVSRNSALVISEYGLDCKPLNSSRAKGNKWETSDLCNWLKKEFYLGAFSPEEWKQVREVSCLSFREVERYFADYRDRICRPTLYA